MTVHTEPTRPRDPLERLLAEPPEHGRHCVRTLACVTGARCVCACPACAEARALSVDVPFARSA